MFLTLRLLLRKIAARWGNSGIKGVYGTLNRLT
jgi:hypothetical protein